MAYIYTPLSEDYDTRVLELSPALDTSAPLRGKFRCVDLEIDPFYDAISYTWGEPNFTQEIIIDDHFRLRITPNLHDALIRYRCAVGPRSIWVDAICINQNDEDDKRRQVPLMAEIYRSASSVLVWLGKHQKGEDCLRKIALLSQKKKSRQAADLADIISALTELVSLSWFSRRWVIQEVVLNPNVTVYGGTASVAWLRIVQLLNHVSKEHPSPPISHLLTLKELWNIHTRTSSFSNTGSEGREMGILDLLSTFSTTDCVDGRDRIYALAGLASDVAFHQPTPEEATKILVRIDYTKSVEQVYLDFAVAVKGGGDDTKTRRLLLETTRRSDGRGMTGVYSWVPDWRLPILYSELSGSTLTGLKFQSYAVPAPEIVVINTGECVEGQIEQVSVPFPTNGDRLAQLGWLHSVFASLVAQIQHFNKEQTPEEPSLGIFPLLHDFIWAIKAQRSSHESYLRPSSRGIGPVDEHDLNEADDYLERVDPHDFQTTMANRCFFTAWTSQYGKLESIFIGIGPCHMRAGDIFYSPADSYFVYAGQSYSTPLILRAEKNSQSMRPQHIEEVKYGGESNQLLHWPRYSLIGIGYIRRLNWGAWIQAREVSFRPVLI